MTEKAKHRLQHHDLAIIGAGYAGLALANLLIHQKTNNFVIFDALHPPVSSQTGEVRVPEAKKLYQELGWEWHFDNEQLLPEEMLLQDLRRLPKINYHHFCYKICNDGEVSSQRRLSLLIWNRKTDECFRYPSSFDRVVICNGVRSKLSTQSFVPHYMLVDNRILLMGDSRWTKWWDFGYHRITQGANQALKDAMQLSELLQTFNHKGKQGEWRKFNVLSQYRARLRNQLLIGIILSVLLWEIIAGRA